MENKSILGQVNTSNRSMNDGTSSNFDSNESAHNLTAKLNEIVSNRFYNRIKKRHILAIYSFFGFFFGYCIRANLSVAIVDMVKASPHNEFNSLNFFNNTTLASTISTQSDSSSKWSTYQQGYILSSFFYGYIVTQIPAGFLTNKFGGKLFFGAGIGLCSLLSMLMPFATYIGPFSVMFLRVLQGLAQGFMLPSMHCLWSKWSPPQERSGLATFAMSGSYIGSVIALSIGGIIGKAINWQSIFYIFGALGFFWALLWFNFVSESPSEHDTIDPDEKNYIESSLTYVNDNSKIPWGSMFKSKGVWAIVCAHFSENWGFYLMLTEMPTFLSGTMNFKIDEAGFYSSLPYLIMAICLYVSGIISDFLIDRKYDYKLVRKIFCCAGLGAQAFFMFIIALINNQMLIIVFIIFAIGFGGMPWASFGVNHLDIGAGYANILMSISNTFASLPGIFSPILTSHLVDNHSKSDWNIVFFIAAIIYVFGAIIFGLFGSGEIEPWAISHTYSKRSISDENLKRNKNETASSNNAYASDETYSTLAKTINDKKTLIDSDFKALTTHYDTLSSTVALPANNSDTF